MNRRASQEIRQKERRKRASVRTQVNCQIAQCGYPIMKLLTFPHTAQGVKIALHPKSPYYFLPSGDIKGGNFININSPIPWNCRYPLFYHILNQLSREMHLNSLICVIVSRDSPFDQPPWLPPETVEITINRLLHHPLPILI